MTSLSLSFSEIVSGLLEFSLKHEWQTNQVTSDFASAWRLRGGELDQITPKFHVSHFNYYDL